MKLNKPKNTNYCTTVVQIKNITPLEGCDNVVGTNIFGYQAIVSKDTKIGDIGLVFVAETQLSDEYCFNNNMYRHGDKNKDQSAKGYIEDNRRVKAIKFRGHVSNCLFMKLDSLSYVKGIDDEAFLVGTEFDGIGEHEICKKYEVAVKGMKTQTMSESYNFVRVEKKHMPEHVDSINFFKYKDHFNKGDEVIVTQKLHGTSVRIGHTIVGRKLNLIEKFLRFVGVKIQLTEFDYVYGSRKVIKDINNPHHNHFYDTDIWTEAGESISSVLPKNYIAYGEIVGWTKGGQAIQKNYTYNLPQGKYEVYIYRIAIVNEQGIINDLSWDQVKEFCTNNNLKYVPELWRGKIQKFDADKYMNIRYYEEGYTHCVQLGEAGNNMDIVDEGVCIRKEGIVPTIMKAKCSKFLEHETKILDEGVQDLESANVETVEEVIINPNTV